MIEIKDISGNILVSVPVTMECEQVEELMKSDYVQLSWSSDSSFILSVGAYIEYKGEKYSLLEPYTPEQKDELEYSYSPQFKSRVMAWGKIPFFMYTYDVDKAITNREPDWSLTDNPGSFMSVICSAIRNETGEEWTYTVDASLPVSASLSFQSNDIFSALNEIANAFETEWWVDKANNIIHLSKASHGTAVTLEVGNNVCNLSITAGKEEYYTRFYAFGSTRNITQDYKGSNSNNIVNKRLTLDPVKYPNGYKDIRPDLKDGEIFSKVLIFDDVYPSSKLAISDVRSRLMYKLDEGGNKIQIGTKDGSPVYDQYAIWYFQIPGYTFKAEDIIEDKNLSVRFDSGTLAGREFDLVYHEVAQKISTSDGLTFQVKSKDFEIKFIEESSYIIPAMTGLVPADTNEIILFNIEMPAEYTASAYVDLEAALDKEIERLSSDLNNYQFQSNPVSFYNSNPGLSIGRIVTYKNGSYSYTTRVIKLVTKIDCECEQTVTIGNEKVRGNTQELKEEVASANKDLNLLSVFNDMTSSLQQSYSRTQQMMLDGFAAIKNIWQLKEDEQGNRYALSRYSVVTEGDLILYGRNEDLKVSTVLDALPLGDGLAIVDGKLTVIGGTGGGLDETELANYLTEYKYIKADGTTNQLLKADGSTTGFKEDYVSGAPTYLVGGVNAKDYHLYMPGALQVLGSTYLKSISAYDTPKDDTLEQAAHIGSYVLEMKGTAIGSYGGYDTILNVGADKGRIFQLRSVKNADEIYYRNIIDTSFSEWRKLWHSGNANCSNADWAAYTLRSYRYIEVNSEVDTKLVFNNTDGEKYSTISFQENGVQYAAINANKDYINFWDKPIKTSRLYLDSTGNPYIDGGGSLFIPMVSTTGGEARGIWYRSTSTDNPTSSGIGAYYSNTNFSHLFMGWGDSPWNSSTNFHVNSTEIQYKGNTVWHAGNMGAGSGLNADTLDGYHRHALFTGGIWDFLNNGTNGSCYRSIVVNGDKDTYYPVVIAVNNNDNWIDNIITVSKTLGSQTPNWSGNHSNGTSSGIFRFHYRTNVWDGNAGLLNTVNRTMPYANWVGHLEFASSSSGKAVVWLRGGGAQYNIHCNNALSEANIYYSRTNIASDQYPAWVEPKTSGNYGYFANATVAPCFSTVYFSNNEYYINDASFKIGLFEATSQDFKIRSKRALVGTTDRLYINYGNDWTNVQINGIIDFNRAIFPNDRVSIGANDFWDAPKLSIATHLYPIAFYNPNGTSNKRRYYFSLGADNLSINSLNDGNSWVRNLVTFYHDGQTEIHGNNIIKGKTFAHAQTAYGSTPAISLAIGDSDTGFNWKSDGIIGIWSNNGERGYWDSNIFYWGGTIQVGGDFVIYKTSDIRLKINPKEFDAHDILSRFGGVWEYDYTDEALSRNPSLRKHSIGLIAQNVEKVFPWMVHEHDGYKSVNYYDTQFISLLAASEIQTINQLKVLNDWKTNEEKEIDRLKKENINLRKRVSALEELVNDKTIM